MVSKGKRAELAGSLRKLPFRSKLVGPAQSDAQIEVSVRLRSKRGGSITDRQIMELGARSPSRRQYLSREELAARHGADPADVAKIDAFAHEHGLTVTSVHLSSRIIKLKGTIAAFNSAFGVKLSKIKRGTEVFRGRKGSILVPAKLHGIITGVHGLDDRSVARPYFRMHSGKKKKGANRGNARDRSLAVTDVARLYNHPAKLTGKGQCIALIELNTLDKKGRVSGTGFKSSDIAAFFKRIGIPAPEIVSVGVDGGANRPGKSSTDEEVVGDIEVAGAIAPGAKIAVYFAPSTTKGFIDAVNAAVHDAVRRPSIISISWGTTEDPDGQPPPGMFFDALNEAFRDAAAMGITVCVASGDYGSAGMAPADWDGRPHTEFPASSPFVLACGGTKLESSNGKIKRETVWNEGPRRGAGGGGISSHFRLPAYQKKVDAPKTPNGFKGRGVPDVAGNADRATGYQLVFNGRVHSGGGTSAVAPLMAGLIALINEHLVKESGKTSGFVNPLIYAAGSKSAFRDISEGNNDLHGNLAGKYTARAGSWDACSGIGVADGAKLLRLLSR
jgi:kumamolisin